MSCIVLLCGLPSSGKSFLVRGLIQKLLSDEDWLLQLVFSLAEKDSTPRNLKLSVYHVEFDKLFEDLKEEHTFAKLSLLSISNDSNSSSSSSLPIITDHFKSEWKITREEGFLQIKNLLTLTNNAHSEITQHIVALLPPISPIIEYTTPYPQFKYLDSAHQQQPIQNEDTEKFSLVFVDDNMYYRSMRNRYYRLAKSIERTSFLQVFVNCSESQAILQNDIRNQTGSNINRFIPSDVITIMNKRFEIPNPLGHHWETQTIFLSSPPDPKLFPWHDLLQAWKNPLFEKIGLLDEVTREKDKQQTLTNLIHQLDIRTRKALTSIMTTLPHTLSPSPLPKQELAKKLNEARRKFLEGVRNSSGIDFEGDNDDMDLVLTHLEAQFTRLLSL